MKRITWVDAQSTHGEKIAYDDNDSLILEDIPEFDGAVYHIRHDGHPAINACIRALQYKHNELCQTTPAESRVVGLTHFERGWCPVLEIKGRGLALLDPELWTDEDDPIESEACDHIITATIEGAGHIVPVGNDPDIAYYFERVFTRVELFDFDEKRIVTVW